MVAVRAEKLGKRYKQYAHSSGRLIEWVTGGRVQRHNPTWVLRGASFEVRAGESLAIVGANGAGKSSLLKLIAGLTRPSEGSVAVNGRVAVLQLGLGFHQEFSGRQNAYAAAELLGVRTAEVARLMPEVEAFAEIGAAIDDPVRTYSSGMQVRLAFAIATAARPDILIIDEVLAVGDAYFQQKCIARIHRFRDEGTTLLFVSHDPAAIKRLCERSILLDRGLLIREGPSGEVLDYYNAIIARMTSDYEIREGAALRSQGGTLRSGSGEVLVTKVELLGEQGPVRALPVGARLRVRVEGEAKQDVDEVTVGIAIRDRLGVEAFGINTHLLGVPPRALAQGEAFCAEFALPLNLGVGSYTLSTAVHVGATHIEGNYDWWDDVVNLQVIPGEEARFVGIAYLPTEVSFAAGAAEPIRIRSDARAWTRS
jgi:lipopolysaccharide transport system ATP-binding protein